MKKQFLVVYHWLSKYGNGYGNVDFSSNADALSIHHIRGIERQICDAYCYDNVVVLNFINLADKQEESEDTE